MMVYVVGIAANVLLQVDDACRDADLIIHTFLHAVGAHTLAREKKIADIHIQTFPMSVPTGDYPNVTLPDLKFPLLNRLTHILSEKMTWWVSRLGFEYIRRLPPCIHFLKLVRPRFAFHLGAWSIGMLKKLTVSFGTR
jgi:hypothetical protein